MDLNSILHDTTPEDRLATYRMLGIGHAVLIVPYDSLSRLAKQGALTMAAEWGRELGELREMRTAIEHATNRELALGNAWLTRIIQGRVHPADASYWIDEIERWSAGEEADPRLDAFRRGWREVADTLPPVRPAGLKCGCGSCREQRRGARRR